MSWMKDIIGTEKPIIAMCHLQPMPGDPYYDKGKGMKHVLDTARHELYALRTAVLMRLCFPMSSVSHT